MAFFVSGCVIGAVVRLAVVELDLLGREFVLAELAGLACAGAIGVFVGMRKFKQIAPGDGEPRCASCGYCLRGNISGRCPECGTPVGPYGHE